MGQNLSILWLYLTIDFNSWGKNMKLNFQQKCGHFSIRTVITKQCVMPFVSHTSSKNLSMPSVFIVVMQFSQNPP